jgi:DNA gyrase inhibitor GyrI
MEPISFTGIIGGVFAIAKAVPVFDKWLETLATAYIQWKQAEMREENRGAIRKALSTQDQRPIEEAFGNPDAGEIAPVRGSEIRDSLPGVE